MGGLGHSKFFLAWGIPFPNYIKSSGSHITMVQTLLMEGQSPCLMLTTRRHSGFPPHERHGLIQKVHSELGHFGVKRTYSLFAPHYHWKSMYAQVRNFIARCEQCDRVITSFSF